jgi:glycosyltransferase involved in cell wall biosynthesis
MPEDPLIVGINASRARSGGVKTYIKGILSNVQPEKYGIKEIHIWSYPELLNSIPDKEFLIKHSPKALNKCLLAQILWEKFLLKSELHKINCSILFNVSAASTCSFKPAVTKSSDLLSYEPGIIKLYGFNYDRARILVLKYIQNKSFKHADGVIFLTNYGANIIQKSCGKLSNISIIPHGVNDIFKKINVMDRFPNVINSEINCIYVSNIEPYKHQFEVIKAILLLRRRGYKITIKLIGGGRGYIYERLKRIVSRIDPNGNIIQFYPFLSHFELISHIINSHIFIFASACEAFGITLLEGMAAGMPIACSNKSSLPETLKDGGVYFDPESHFSIAEAIEYLITNPNLAVELAKRAKEIASNYSWQKTAEMTFSFIVKTLRGINN